LALNLQKIILGCNILRLGSAGCLLLAVLLLLDDFPHPINATKTKTVAKNCFIQSPNDFYIRSALKEKKRKEKKRKGGSLRGILYIS
jgi:hypothetical protein